jgi:V8-like Glu-specific endopeptidase
MYTHSNSFFKINNAGVYYDIDTKCGQSGSPVYLFNHKRKLVVGIHKGCDPEEKLNFATMITNQVIEVLKVWAKEMEVPFSVLNI